ncbi:MAG: NAD(P)(+) transhydrogenase (Re/Si-specific) subunit beta [Gammaproteobacteria bacterium AqS3]|nr:NAD(P)(+) transhydrogenase (Re/Si-specific) subunit beta [Gammaproteobacteria bacterium AqS3]
MSDFFNVEALTGLGYILASVLFIFGLKQLSSPNSAIRGNLTSACGMLLAVLVTLLDTGILDYRWIGLGLALGALIGLVIALRVQMTGMPQLVALFNGFGGVASLLLGAVEFAPMQVQGPDGAVVVAIALAVLIGGITFSGSLIAFGKLAEILPGRPLLFPGQQAFNVLLLLAALGLLIVMPLGLWEGQRVELLIGLVGIALLLGILAVIPIGGADMPVVISLLNSYSGLAACAAGFVILNKVLIVAGALVGAAGLILTGIMCKAMNRSLANVLFSGFGAGADSGGAGATSGGEVKALSIEDAWYLLEAARSVVVIPGYGMAVAQAQHAVRELGELLEANGAEVRYGIHPVAGRMPGHMNVLLAEANVDYDRLAEPQDINPIMETVDLCIVIGANDVVNPDARSNESSPIYGMPVLEADRARTVFVLKRSMASGFSGIDNPLFYAENTRMIFGDAKDVVSALVAEFKGSE